MEYRRLGESGIQVSPICLGAMMFGDRTDLATAQRIADSALEAGINFIDTADGYAKGESERVVGRVVGERRNRWIVATKVHNSMGGGPNNGGLSRRWLLHEIDASLERLACDHIDIWYFHRDDRDTPLEETLGAVADIIRAGKVRYFGLSNFQAWRIAEVTLTCRLLGIAAPIVCQPLYNAVNRMAEAEILPACAHFGLGVVSYSPLARGVLTGKYLPGEAPPQDSRAGRRDPRVLEDEYRPESLRLAQQIKAHAAKRGISAGQFALGWVLNNARVTSVLAGPRTLEQWREYLGALDYAFSAEDEALIDGMVHPGHPSTPGYTDSKFPVIGRVPRR